MNEVRKSSELARDKRQIKTIDQVGADLTDITTSITGRFENFDRKSKDFWTDINAETFPPSVSSSPPTTSPSAACSAASRSRWACGSHASPAAAAAPTGAWNS
jgi:hypothetical protein